MTTSATLVHNPRMKGVAKPYAKLEGDLKKLTLALTSEEDVGLGKPFARLCLDGYLVCPEEE
jgi:hypothetical protein